MSSVLSNAVADETTGVGTPIGSPPQSQRLQMNLLAVYIIHGIQHPLDVIHRPEVTGRIPVNIPRCGSREARCRREGTGETIADTTPVEYCTGGKARTLERLRKDLVTIALASCARHHESHLTKVIGIAVIVTEERHLGGVNARQVSLRFRLLRLRLIRHEVGNGDGRQDADDRHDDHQLNQGKTLVTFDLLKHCCSSLLMFHRLTFRIHFLDYEEEHKAPLLVTVL